MGESILIVVHPGSACGSADFNLDDEAPPLRDALAVEIMAWRGDIMIIDGALSDELDHYAMLGLAITNATDRKCRRVVRERACDFSSSNWPSIVEARYRREWPDGPHDVTITGAWYGDGDSGETGCVNAVAKLLADQNPTISPRALRL